MDIIDKLFGSRDAQTLHDDGVEPLSSTYRCVEIKPNSAAPCPPVQALKGKRFFPDEIPELPLPGCTAETCHCSYELFEDRRKEPRSDISTQAADQRPAERNDP